MMATVPHATSGLGLKKFQADGFLLKRVYLPPHPSTSSLGHTQLPTQWVPDHTRQ